MKNMFKPFLVSDSKKKIPDSTQVLSLERSAPSGGFTATLMSQTWLLLQSKTVDMPQGNISVHPDPFHYIRLAHPNQGE